MVTFDIDDVRLPRRVGGMAGLDAVTGTVCAGSIPFVKVGRGCRAEASDGESGGGEGTGVDSGVVPGDGAADSDVGSGGESGGGGGGGAAAGVNGGFGDGACECFAIDMCSGADDRKNRTQTKPMLSTTDNTRMALCQP